jgi:hypothetical protein
MTTSGNLNARAIAADGSGNSFVTGSFDGSASFGNSVTLNSTSGSADVFVAKYDINGVAQWATNSGGSSDEGATGIALNGTGNIYITGGFRGNTSFGTTTLTSAGDLDVFVARLDSTGTFRWATRGGGGSGDTGHSIQVDSTGAITVSGWFGFVTSTFGATSLNNSGSDDIVVWRLFE